MERDLEHLRLLAVFHYIVAGCTALLAFIPVFHVVLGIAMVTGKLPNSKNDAMPVPIGWLFIIMGSVFITCGLGFAGCLAMAGRLLTRQKHYMYCLVMAALACAFMPFGTALGVFTIIVLQRDSVKQLFGRPVSSAPAVSG